MERIFDFILKYREENYKKLDDLEINKIYGEFGVILIDEKNKKFVAVADTSDGLFKDPKPVKGIDDVRLSFTATNLLTLTKYTGSDPQINADTSAGGVGGNGIDNYPVPTTRGYNMSLQVAF